MEQTLQKVQQELKSEEWEIRVDGLKSLRALGEATTGTPAERVQLAKLLKEKGVAKLVTDQLRDMRSIVASAACRCATTLATGLGSDGRGLADEHWTATLLSVASGGAPRGVQEAATEALSAIVDAAAPNGNAPLFARLCATACDARAPAAKKHAMDLAARALGRWRPEASWAQAGPVVEKRARDADGNARAAARGLWLALRHAGFAKEAQHCLDSLDASARKTFEKAASNAPQPGPPLSHLPPPPPKPAKKKVVAPPKKRVVLPPAPPSPERPRTQPTPALIDALAQQCASPHWDVRRDAVAALREAQRDTSGGDHSIAWKALVVAVGDAHHKVALAALEACGAGLEAGREAVEGLLATIPDWGAHFGVTSALGALVTRCCSRLADGRAPLRRAAGTCLDGARRAFAPGALLHAAAPAVRSLTPLRARAALHEFLAAVARVDGESNGPSYLSNDTQLGNLVGRVAATLAATRAAASQRETAANDGAAPCHAAATRLLVALFRADRPRVSSRVAKLALAEKQACEHALSDAAPDFKSAVARSRREAVAESIPSAFVAPETEQAARATLGAALAALAREVRGGADAAQDASAARADIARLARKDLLAGCWAGKCDAVAHLLVERACGGVSTSTERYLTVDDSDDSNDGRLHTARGVAQAPTTSLGDLAARHESLAALRTLARRRPKAFRGSVDSCVPRLLQLARSTAAPLELAWAAERVVAAVADRGDAARCLELLLPDVFDATPPKTPDGSFLQALDAAASRAPLCRLAGLCCARAPAQSVRNALPTLLPALSAACSAPGADVRKAAVDGLVDVYRALGDGVVPKFKQFLRDDQVRLVGTYVHRAGLSAGA
jgi:hypothetical protein